MDLAKFHTDGTRARAPLDADDVPDGVIHAAALEDSGAVPGTYLLATVTINEKGLVTAAADGDVPGEIAVRAVITGYDFTGNTEVPHGSAAGISDGVTPAVGQKVLLINETDQVYNGVWIVAAGNWTRSGDTIKAGTQVQVMQGGTLYGGAIFYCRNTGAVTVGTTALAFRVATAVPPPNSVIASTVVDASLTENELAASVAGPGLTGGAGNALAVNVDDVTLEIAVDNTVQVKGGGIDTAQLAPESVTPAKIDPSAGSPGQVLYNNGASVAWDTLRLTVGLREVADADTAVLSTDTVVQYSGLTATRVATLPSAADPDNVNRMLVFKDGDGTASGTNKIQVTAAFPSTIDGAASVDIATAYGALRVYSDGSNWFTW